MTVVVILILVFWLFCNVAVVRSMSKDEMYEEFVEDQCLVGKICANAFYSLAWLLKKVLK